MNDTSFGPVNPSPKPALEGPIAEAYARVTAKYSNALKALADTAEPESTRGS
jgi:hypothetical protein